MNLGQTEMRKEARRIFDAGLQAVDPQAAIQRCCRLETDGRLQIAAAQCRLSDFDRIRVIGFGKAAAVMSQAMEALLQERIEAGLVVVKYGHGAPLQRVEVLEAGHPVPDENGEEGARRILALAESAGKRDLLVCLISGGGSALLPLPAPGLTLADKQKVSRILIDCGADIHEINAIRKHLSAIKGGLLARAAYPARLITLVLSDVVGDDLDVIASGPCSADTSTFSDCLDIIDHYGIGRSLPAAVIEHLQAGAAKTVPETPKFDDPAFSRCTHHIIGSNIDALEAARDQAEAMGYQPLVLSSMIEGDTVQAAGFHAAVIREIIRTGQPLTAPACILSGGETTVVVRGDGLGGRNQEFALAIAPCIAGIDHPVVVLSAGTDGTDGPTDAAGAIVDAGTVSRAAALGLHVRDYLRRNDAYRFFQQTGELLITGPTHTNVMDMRVILVRK
ncbi:MAG TPA: glycerate kinase [Desulfobacterales bacterium]